MRTELPWQQINKQCETRAVLCVTPCSLTVNYGSGEGCYASATKVSLIE